MTIVLDKTTRRVPPQSACHPAASRVPSVNRDVKVNGVVITRNAIGRETQHHPAAKPIDAWRQAAQALVVRELLLQEARGRALVPAPLEDGDGRRETDEEALIRQVIELSVPAPHADTETCRRVYEQKREAFRSADLYAVRHILIAAPPEDAPQRISARRLAEALRADIGRDPHSFSVLAAEHSACPSRAQGGSLGQISNNQTVPEFEAALADIPIGAPAIVETRYGLHLVVVDQRIDGQKLPFEVVEPEIAAWLSERAHAVGLRCFIADLVAAAEIDGISFDAAEVTAQREDRADDAR